VNTAANELDIVKHKFRDFYYDELTPSEFDEWLCTAANLEDVLGSDTFFQLIDLDYSSRDEVEEARHLVKRFYSEQLQSDICRDRVEDVLQGMLAGELELPRGCEILWDLSLNGADFIPAVFAGYASELEDPKWESFYRERVLKDAEEFLRKLNATR
jgi:hypothetical protein